MVFYPQLSFRVFHALVFTVRGSFFSPTLWRGGRDWGNLRFPQHKNSSKAAQVPVPSYSKYSWDNHFAPDCPLSHCLSTFPQHFIQPAAKRHLPPPHGVRGGGGASHCACICFRARPRARLRHEWLSGTRGGGKACEHKIAAVVGGDVKRQRRTSVSTASAGGITRPSQAWCAAVACCSERSVASTPPSAWCARPGASNPTCGCRFFAFLLPLLPGGLFLAFFFLSPFSLWRTRAWPVIRRAWSPIFVRKVVWSRVWDFSGHSVHVRWRAGMLACR